MRIRLLKLGCLQRWITFGPSGVDHTWTTDAEALRRPGPSPEAAAGLALSPGLGQGRRSASEAVVHKWLIFDSNLTVNQKSIEIELQIIKVY